MQLRERLNLDQELENSLQMVKQVRTVRYSLKLVVRMLMVRVLTCRTLNTVASSFTMTMAKDCMVGDSAREMFIHRSLSKSRCHLLRKHRTEVDRHSKSNPPPSLKLGALLGIIHRG